MIDKKNILDFIAKNPTLLSGIRRGVEREALRVNKRGRFSRKLHFEALGCALTNPYITKDFSENLLELITPPLDSVEETYLFLENLHKYVLSSIDDELLWPASMPSTIGRESDILVANFGQSNIGIMKKVYRDGLSRRYGKLMQVIAGIHYNFSMPETFWTSLYEQFEVKCSLQDFISARYMAAVRNFRRNGWLIPCLFGASPAVCRTFVKNLSGLSNLTQYNDQGMLIGEVATSLRMSDLGYKNKSQGELNISYDSVGAYATSLIKAVKTKDSVWDRIGVEDKGKFKQLSASILQVENEYYGTVRPKRVSKSGESPAMALKERGVEYIEIRSIDINPYSFCGISKDQMYLLDTLLVYCIINSSPLITSEEELVVDQNFNLVVNSGRTENLKLQQFKKDEIELKVAASNLLNELRDIASILDKAYNLSNYVKSIDFHKAQLNQGGQLLSEHVFLDMLNNKNGFIDHNLNIAKTYKEFVKKNPLSKKEYGFFKETAYNSLKNNEKMQVKDSVEFRDFLSDYFSRIR